MMSNGMLPSSTTTTADDFPQQQTQTGPLFSGPGARNNRPSFRVKLLTVAQYKAIESAKKFAIEEGIKVSSSNKTVHVQQQQMQSAFTVMQKQQAWSLMCRVYIGSINFTVTDEHLRTAFGVFGPLKNLNLSVDHVTNKHKGYAFLEFEVPEAATLAVEQMNGLMLGGRNLKVGRPSNMPQAQTLVDQYFAENHVNNRVYVSCIHPALLDSDLISVFEAFGKVVACDLPKDATCPTKHKGYAYLEYEKDQSAIDAVAAMNMFDLGGQFIRVGKAVTPGNPDPNSLLSFPTSSSSSTTSSSLLPATITSSTSSSLPAPTTTSSSLPTTTSLSSSSNNENGVTTTAEVNITNVNNNNNHNKNDDDGGDDDDNGGGDDNGADDDGGGDDDKNNNMDIDEQMNITSTTPTETCTMLLENAVTIEDVDDDLEGEMLDECSRYGKVLKVSVQPGKADDDVKIYVRYTNTKDTQTAIMSLHGRFFAGRQVVAKFSDLDIEG